GIAPAIENFAANDVDDGGHVLNFPGSGGSGFGGVLHGAQANVNALGPAFSGRSSRVRIDCSKVDISVQTFTLIDRGNAMNRRQFLGTAAAGVLAAPVLLRRAD